MRQEAAYAEAWASMPHEALVAHLARLSWVLSEGARLHRKGAEDRHLGYMTQITGVILFLQETTIHQQSDWEPLEHAHSEGLDEQLGGRKPGGLRRRRNYQGAYSSSDEGMMRIYLWAACEILIARGDQPALAFERVARKAMDAVASLRRKSGDDNSPAARLRNMRNKINSIKSHKDFPSDGKEAAFIASVRGQLAESNGLPEPDRYEYLSGWFDHVIAEANRHLNRIT
jgi:hypothetical protein